MRFAVAATILAQTLPVASSSNEAAPLSGSLAAVIEKRNKIQSIVQSFSPQKLDSVNRRTESLQDARHSKEDIQAARKAVKALQNTGNSKLSTPCDPNKFDADTGLLSCDSESYCKETKASPLGGECASKEASTSSALSGKKKNANFGGLGKALRNKRPVKIEGSMVECDPSKSAASDADVGVLDCEDGERCVQSKSSSLGGLCVQEHQAEGGKHRKLQYGDYYDDDDLYNSNSSYCDYSNFDNSTNTGTVSCDLSGQSIGTCNPSLFSYVLVYYNGTYASTSYTIAFEDPYPQSASLSYDYSGDTPTCTTTFNGITCNSCDVFYYVDFYNETNTCYEFDCTNALTNHTGGTCGYSYNELLPIIENYCFVPCSVCPYGFDFSGNITTPGGDSISCIAAISAGAFGYLDAYECAALEVGAPYFCDCDIGFNTTDPPCNICGDGNLTEPYFTIPGSNYTCNDIYLAGALGFIPKDECRDSQYLGPFCCDASFGYDRCELCPDGQPLANPDGIIPSDDGDEVTCADIALIADSGLIGPEDCAEGQLSITILCGCGDDFTPPSTTGPFDCNLCEEGKDIKNPDLMIETQTQEEPQSCATLNGIATGDSVTEAQCRLLQAISSECCTEALPEETPSAAPTEAKSAAPTETKEGETVTEAPTETLDDESGSMSYLSGKSNSMMLIGLSLSMVGYFLG